MFKKYPVALKSIIAGLVSAVITSAIAAVWVGRDDANTWDDVIIVGYSLLSFLAVCLLTFIVLNIVHKDFSKKNLSIMSIMAIFIIYLIFSYM
jgi:hypothetical protein